LRSFLYVFNEKISEEFIKIECIYKGNSVDFMKKFKMNSSSLNYFEENSVILKEIQ